MREMKSYYDNKNSEFKLNTNAFYNYKKVKLCGCLLSCTYISYGMEVFSVENDQGLLTNDIKVNTNIE